MKALINPFSNPHVTGWNKVASARHRATLSFLEADRSQLTGNVLDVGGDSPFGKMLEAQFGITLEHTDFDLDLNQLTGEWDNIFSFEVIEHLGSPLRHLQEMREHLTKSGAIWLSTPLVVNRLRPTHLFRDPHHVFEMDWSQLNFIINKSGLTIARKSLSRYLDTWKYFTGPRPIIRFFTDRCVLLKLTKK